MTKIKINSSQEDRLALAQILIKNGYTVRISSSSRGDKKAKDYYVEHNGSEGSQDEG